MPTHAQENNDTHAFNLETGAWECPACCSISSALTARSVFGTGMHTCTTSSHGQHGCGHAGHIVAFGGEVDPSDKGHAGAGCFTASMMCYDTAKQEWHGVEAAGEAPSPRGWFAACSGPQGLYVHGGVNGDNERLADMHLLSFG